LQAAAAAIGGAGEGRSAFAREGRMRVNRFCPASETQAIIAHFSLILRHSLIGRKLGKLFANH
jgi:hypothetical protein